MSDSLADRRRQVLAALLGPAEPELTCDECFEELDRYVDLELTGRRADGCVGGMRAHLIGCPACREDYESLRDLAATSPRGAT